MRWPDTLIYGMSMSFSDRFRSTKAGLKFQAAARSGNRQALDASIDDLTSALKRAPEGSHAWLIATRMHAAALTWRAIATSDLQDMFDATSACDLALTTVQHGHQFRAAILTISSEANSLRALLLKDHEAAARAVDLIEQAVSEPKKMGINDAEILMARGMAYYHRFDTHATDDDLLLSISMMAEFLARYPAHRHTQLVSSNLAIAQELHFRRGGSLSDLENAFSLLRDANSGQHPPTAQSRLNFQILQERGAGRPSSNTQALSPHLTAALNEIRSGRGPKEPLQLLRLAAMGGAAGPDTHQDGISAQQVELYEYIVATLPREHREHPTQQANLGACLSNHGAAEKDLDLLARAEAELGEALGRLTEIDPMRFMVAINLGKTAAAIASIGGDSTHVLRARSHFRAAIEWASNSLESSRQAAEAVLDFELDCGERSSSSLWDAAHYAAETSIRFLDAQPTGSHRRAGLGRTVYLLQDSLAALLELGDVAAASKFVESYVAKSQRQGNAAPIGWTPIVLFVSRIGAYAFRLADAESIQRMPGLDYTSLKRLLTRFMYAYGVYREGDPDGELATNFSSALREVSREIGAHTLAPLRELVGGQGSATNLLVLGPLDLLPVQAAIDEIGSLVDLTAVYRDFDGAEPVALARSFYFRALHIGDDLAAAGMEVDIVAARLREMGGSHSSPTPNLFEDISVLHLAGHAKADYDDPVRSTIRLEQGLSLSAQEIGEMDLRHLDLVVLAACESSAIPFEGGDEPEGLAPAFLRAGARCVIGCRWVVEDASALAFSRYFYAALNSGLSSNLALNFAQRRMRGGAAAEVPSVSSSASTHSPDASVASDVEHPLASPRHWAGWQMWGSPVAAFDSSP